MGTYEKILNRYLWTTIILIVIGILLSVSGTELGRMITLIGLIGLFLGILACIKIPSREEVKKQLNLCFSLRTIRQSWIGKLLKTIIIIAFTLGCCEFFIIYLNDGKGEEIITVVGALTILTELKVIWGNKKQQLDIKENGSNIIYAKKHKTEVIPEEKNSKDN